MLKKIILTVLSCSLLLVGCSQKSTDTNQTGDKNQVQEETVSPNLSSFSTISLTEEEVTQDIFKDYDITMVNIWATWCGPCVGEIPELQTVYENLPENANLVTICTDFESESEAAKEILGASSAEFLALKPTDEMNDSLLKMVSGIPTTVFVDSEGKMVGDAIVGVPGKEPAKAYLSHIEELLASQA